MAELAWKFSFDEFVEDNDSAKGAKFGNEDLFSARLASSRDTF
jgi:hypothetical protein